MGRLIARRVFDVADQERFATLTGDANPMHMDALAARRTQAGAPVTHGVHSALWAIDELATSIPEPITHVDAEFLKFIYVGSEVSLELTRESESAIRAELRADGLLTTKLEIAWGGTPPANARVSAGGTPESIAEPVPRTLGELKNLTGRLPPGDSAIAASFPRAASKLGAARVVGIGQLSTLVGMVCPGLHSIFAGFRIAAGGSTDDALSFSVDRIDERFQIVEISVSGYGIDGQVNAFVRQPPIAQPTLADLQAKVDPQEFATTTALIVGGSRGLGALTARAIVAGGGRVIVTFAVGQAEAQEIARELGPSKCQVLRFDARADAGPQISHLPWEVTELYYFASTQIFRQKSAWYVSERFSEFCDVYVNGFERVCAALRERQSAPLSVFYPSSIFVDERPRDMTEYSMAKAAGEMLCEDMQRFVPRMRVISKRLPRILTDQTATVMPVEGSDGCDVMLPIIRSMNETPNRNQPR